MAMRLEKRDVEDGRACVLGVVKAHDVVRVARKAAMESCLIMFMVYDAGIGCQLCCGEEEMEMRSRYAES